MQNPVLTDSVAVDPVFVSVVVPTFHRPDLLQRCLDAVASQTLPASAYEIVVVDDGHDDATLAQVEGLRRQMAPILRYVRPAAGRGPAVARNAGWRVARGRLVAFTDDDTVPAPDWLEQGQRAMARHPQWSALSGRVQVPLSPARRRRPTDHELMTLGLEQAEFVTANAFVRRDELHRVNGFDEQFQRAWHEDSDLQFRLMDGGTVGRCRDAVVFHPVRPERWGISLRQQRNAVFDALLFKKHPRLYRERLHPQPPWHYYGIVSLGIGAVGAALARQPAVAIAAAVGAIGLVARFAWRRLARTSRAPDHVVEMIATSAVIPFLSVWWRLRGALRFRVLFL